MEQSLLGDDTHGINTIDNNNNNYNKNSTNGNKGHEEDRRESSLGIVETIHKTLTREIDPTSTVETLYIDDDCCSQMLWSTPDGMLCLIWVLHHAELRTTVPLDKFTDQVHSKSLQGEINASICVAECACSIPGVGVFKVDETNGMPCIYLADVSSSGVAIHVVSQFMRRLWGWYSMKSPSPNEEGVGGIDRQLVTNYVNDNVKCCKSLCDNFSSRKRLINELYAECRAEEEELIRMTKLLTSLKKNTICNSETMLSEGGHRHCSIGILSKHPDAIMRMVEQSMKYYDENNKWPSRKDIGITPSEARTVGGFKHILSLARERIVTFDGH